MLQKFLSYYKPYKKMLILDLFAAVVLSGIDLVFPMISRQVINDYIPNKEMTTLLSVGIIMLILFGVRCVSIWFMNYKGHVMGAHMGRDMRRDLFKHYLTLPFKFYDEHKTGKLMSHLINDLDNIAEVAHHVPEDALVSTIMIIGSFAFLLSINWQLTCVLLIMVVILFVFAFFKRFAMQKAFRLHRERTAVINSQIENTISGIRLCQSYANEPYEFNRFEKVNEDHFQSSKLTFKTMGELQAGTNFIVDAMNLCIIVIGGLFSIKGWLNTGDLIAFLLYAHFFISPVKSVVSMIQQIQSGMSGFERFYQMINVKSDIQNSEQSIEAITLKGNIRFDAVSFGYESENNVLNNLTLDIPSGKHIALVGPSGVGKSTIINLIPRFYEVEKGKISIDGHDIKQIDLKTLRKSIGIVQQDVFMFHGTIRENIAYGDPDASLEAVEKAAKQAFIHDFIVNLPLGYETVVGERGVKLSGGQKQRLSIARVFLKNPSIVILDEATSALDNESERFVKRALDDLAIGKTTVTVAHRLSTIMNADEIVVLKDNEIAERGKHETLVKNNGIYHQLYTAQFKGFMPDEIK